MTKHPIPYADALAVAEQLVTELAPACERILIAGSLRRGKAEVGDIEIVACPRMTLTTDMFDLPVRGMEHSALDDALAQIERGEYTKNGPKYKQFSYGGASVDLFLVTRETWGCVATIRTGSADFTHWLVTPRRQGGGCPSHLRFSGGRIWEGARALETSEERDVFAALDVAWVEPAERNAGRWRR